jgi:HK97 family phage portal protein
MKWRNPFRRTKAAGPAPGAVGNAWFPLWGRRGDRQTGDWQRARRLDTDGMIEQSVVWSCLKLISGDVSKCGPILKQQQPSGIWQTAQNPAYSPVIAKPNAYQSPMQFLETWALSKLVHGNFYGLKFRDNRNVVTGIYPLNPWRVRPMVANDGSAATFYELQSDNLTPGLTETILVPAREIVHDRWNCIGHPLIGLSPLVAAAQSATQMHETEVLMAKFYRNSAQPGSYITAPGHIDPDSAKRLEDKYSEDYSGENAGKILVVGSGLEFKTLSANLIASEIVDQLKYSGTMVCACFGVPLYKTGLMDQPRAINNIEALQIEYFSQALQVLMEGIEDKFSEGLGLAAGLRVFLDIDNLLRMDSNTKATLWGNLVAKSIAAPNEARKAFDLPPIDGGDSVLAMQQMWPLSALANPNRPPPTGALPPPAPEPAKALDYRSMDAEEAAEFLAARPGLVEFDE